MLSIDTLTTIMSPFNDYHRTLKLNLDTYYLPYYISSSSLSLVSSLLIFLPSVLMTSSSLYNFEFNEKSRNEKTKELAAKIVTVIGSNVENLSNVNVSKPVNRVVLNSQNTKISY